MDVSTDILSALSLINSGDVTENDLYFIFDQCNQTIQNNQSNISSCSEIIRVLIFAINALMLEAVKCQINHATLIRSLQDNGLDCSTNKFKLFENFIEKSMRKLYHNISNLELEPNIRFKDLEWSQMLDLKSSNGENIRKKNYIIDIIGSKPSKDGNNHSTTDSISMIFSEQGIQDFYVTIRDCMKNVEHYI
ncbi:uncharacterized protein LOC124490942 [Dermatophagoides farinae]|uniref:COMM domain-containing protein 3 n=1 Tax=Dermatophagoides farinae TaxID=6954 RepID=A0A922HXF9_DERFA|nr:uncharacterized protein LOC124490942 [Dermatophagoides farinae]KAH7646110.1 hypothetical protein HUG17_1648 [Dermatophagoides farinae]KAH9516459.1 hypothetical protein DERF_007195 [Dermatophagoides farinae]